MLQNIPVQITGHVKITDIDTGELLVDQHNDVLYGNMSTALAHALIGDDGSFLFYIGFGNGGAYVNSAGTIGYKTSLGGPGSLIKNPNANLYNTIYVKKLSNDATPSGQYDQNSKAYIPTTNSATNYEDIIVNVVLGYNEPPVSDVSSTNITQSAIDNSSFIGSTGTIGQTNDELVFNEIALYAGSSTVLSGSNTTTTADVIAFTQSQDKLMLTHAIYHPVQKSANRQLGIIYTLRIQMGTLSA